MPGAGPPGGFGIITVPSAPYFTLATMVGQWNDERCIICASRGSLTDAHVIPKAIGGRLSLRDECVTCNSLLGGSVEAPLKRDPAVRFAVETLDRDLGPTGDRLRDRQLYVARDGAVIVRGLQQARGFRVLDTPQDDASIVKSPDRARVDIATTLRRRGAGNTEVARAVEQLEAAAPGDLLNLGRGVAIRQGTVENFQPAFSTRDLVSDACLVGIAYRFLAICAGSAIFAPVLDRVREGLLRGRADGCRVDACMAARPYEPWHGLAVVGVEPVTIDVRLFGRLSWIVGFVNAGLPPELESTSYQIHLRDGSERIACPGQPA